MNTDATQSEIASRRLLGSRLISSAISWEDLLKNACLASHLFLSSPSYMGSAICCVELTIIELSLKAILAMEGYSEKQLKDKSMSHNLVPIYEAVSEEAKSEIERICGYDREKILSELYGIDNNYNGLVNWRYLDFIEDLSSPSTKQHFCDAFVKRFTFSCCRTAEKKCKIKRTSITNIANPIRKKRK